MLLQPRYPLYLSRSLQIYLFRVHLGGRKSPNFVILRAKSEKGSASEARLLFRVHRPWRNLLDVKSDRNKNPETGKKERKRKKKRKEIKKPAILREEFKGGKKAHLTFRKKYLTPSSKGKRKTKIIINIKTTPDPS